MEVMEDKEIRIIETFERVLPKLSEEKKEYLLGFGEGLAMAHEQRREKYGTSDYHISGSGK